MSKKCILTGKTGQFGHRVSHAKNRTKHIFQPNLQKKKIFVPSLGKNVRMTLSTHAIRIIDKLGADAAFKKYNVDLKQFA